MTFGEIRVSQPVLLCAAFTLVNIWQLANRCENSLECCGVEIFNDLFEFCLILTFTLDILPLLPNTAYTLSAQTGTSQQAKAFTGFSSSPSRRLLTIVVP